MEIIYQKNNKYHKALKTSFSNNNQFRWMKYIYKYQIKNDILLCNTLTLSIIKLSKEEYNDVFINDDIKQKLINLLYIVPDNYDEYSIYMYLRKEGLRKQYNLDIKKSLHSYTIFSTLKCNARCGYCYENGSYPRKHMDDHTVDNIIKLILENYSNNHKTVEIHFMGGEPFYNPNVFDKICQTLKDNNIPYKSSFISNCYLITDTIIDKMKNLYNTKNGQVAIDGIGEKYNKIKNYIYTDTNPYEVVINNIKRILSKTDIKISIRLNFNENTYLEQLNTKKILLEELKDFNPRQYHIYFNELYKYYDDEDINKIIQTFEINNVVFGLDLRKKTINDPISGSFCGATHGHSIDIGPSGEFTKCEHIKSENIIGNVNDLYDKNIDIDYDKYKKYYFDFIEVEECKDCNIKPICQLASYCDSCNNFGNKCPILEKYRNTQALNKYITDHYNKYINHWNLISNLLQNKIDIFEYIYKNSDKEEYIIDEY